MEKYTNLDGPMHPYNPNLGQCHLWEGYKIWNGYGRIRCTSISGQKKMILAHRAARICALTPLGKDELARHNCDNRLCVNPSHIISGNHKDNIIDREIQIRNISHFGEKHAGSLLTAQEVFEISAKYDSAAKISKKYSVSIGCIFSIKNKKSWAHLGDIKIIKKPPHSEAHYNANLTNKEAKEIYDSNLTSHELSKLYRVSKSTISGIKTGRTWARVTQI